jgi:hypothetical protein
MLGSNDKTVLAAIESPQTAFLLPGIKNVPIKLGASIYLRRGPVRNSQL